ncbi:cyclic nucleotide-binding domain-containing protein, partial [Myxococcota bacterium]|nr:cyclic nucleotide-binding domain-containing protein [Myxococcota bacterium]
KRGQAEAVCQRVLEYYPQNATFAELLGVINGQVMEEKAAEEQSPDEVEVEEAMDDYGDVDEPTPIAEYNSFQDFVEDHSSKSSQEESWSDTRDSSGENRIPSPPGGVPAIRSSLQESISRRMEYQKNKFMDISTSPGRTEDEVVDIFDDEEGDFFGSEGSTLVASEVKGDFWEKAPLLSELPPEIISDLRSSIEPSVHEPNEYIFRQGDVGTSLFLIIDGDVAVTKLNSGGDDEEIARLGKLDFFGEFALLADHKRHASILTTTRTSLLELPKDLVVELGKKYPVIIDILKNFYRKRLQDTMINNLGFFELIAPDKRDSLLGNLHFHRFAPRTSIIKQGQKSGGFFLILLGEVEIVYNSSEGDKVLGVLSEGEYFGEMALMKRKPAMATVSSVDVVELVQIPAKSFFQILAEHPPIWRRLQEEVSKRVLLDHYFISGRGSGKLSF